MAELKKGLFHDWVPGWLRTTILFLLTIPIMGTSGLYTSNISYMVGSLGTMTEYLMMANYAATIGMVVMFPFLIKVKGFLKSRDILLISLSAMAALYAVCAVTTSPEALILANFMIGCLKPFAMIEVMFPIMTILSPTGDRGQFYSIFYPMIIALGMLFAYLSAQLAYSYTWQYAYYFMIPGILFCLLLVIVFFHNERTIDKIPLKGLDWLSFSWLSATLMVLSYILVFAKVEDYFNSVPIQGACIAFVILLLGFIKRQLRLPEPYLDLSLLKGRNVWSGLLFIFLFGIFLGTSSVQSAFTGSILGYNPGTSAEINLWMIPGILAAGVVCYFWYKHIRYLKGIMLTGFGAYIISLMILYFKFNPGAGVHDFYAASIFRGFAMVLLYSSLGLYMYDRLHPSGMMTAVSLLITFRTFFGPAFFSAVISYGLYHSQIENLNQLAQNMDALDPNVAARFLVSGTSGLYGAVQGQALLLAAQEIVGSVIMAGFGIMLFILLFRFNPINRRKLVKLRKRWRRWRGMEGIQVAGE